MSKPQEEIDHLDDAMDDEGGGDLGLDCGMGEDGQCQYAGTEECDECPFSDEEFTAEDATGRIP